MSFLPPDWPPWLVIVCAVAAAGVALWILAKIFKWTLWLLLIALLVGCAVMAVRILLR